jgi:hypothetical protein
LWKGQEHRARKIGSPEKQKLWAIGIGEIAVGLPRACFPADKKTGNQISLDCLPKSE